MFEPLPPLLPLSLFLSPAPAASVFDLLIWSFAEGASTLLALPDLPLAKSVLCLLSSSEVLDESSLFLASPSAPFALALACVSLCTLCAAITVDVGKERYGMNWPGKAECFKTIQTPSLGTLCPSREESVNFDTTGNVIIEGDNLEVLKLLQKSYLGKVKMIYIDPPYNTGNDFIYPDNYTESLQTYLEYTGQADSHGKKFSTNTEVDGRFHSKWMNMMYPRLYLARNLLSEDGVIFISIDDNEVENLKKICNEIFGEVNFVGAIIVQANKRGQTYKEIAKTHEYLLVYSQESDFELNELDKSDGVR